MAKSLKPSRKKRIIFLTLFLAVVVVVFCRVPIKSYILGKTRNGLTLKELRVKLFPGDPGALVSYADALRETDDYNKAIKTHLLVLMVKKERGVVETTEDVIKSNSLIRKIEGLYSKAITLNAENPKAYYERGNFYLKLTEGKKSLNDFKKAIEIDPYLYEGYFGLANVYMFLKNDKGVFDVYQNILRKFKDDEKVMLDLVLVVLNDFANDSENKYLEDIFERSFNRFLDIIEEQENPKAESFYRLGLIYTRTGAFDRALSAFNRALDIDPEHVNALFDLAGLHGRIGNRAQSISYYEKSLQADPKKIETYINLGNIYWRQGKVEEARTVYKRAQKIDPMNAKVHYHLGVIEELAGNKTEALNLYLKSVNIDPDNGNVWINMGNVSIGLGRLRQAEVYYKKAVEIDRNLLIGWLKLFALAFEDGNYEKAVPYIREAVLLGYEMPEDVKAVLEPYLN